MANTQKHLPNLQIRAVWGETRVPRRVNPNPQWWVDFDHRLKLEFHGLKTYEVMECVLKNMRILEPQGLPMNAAWKSPNLGIQAVHATRPIAILGINHGDPGGQQQTERQQTRATS